MSVFCALFGHARVYEMCFGYVSCARCKQQIGDALAGAFSDAKGVSCECSQCEKNWRALRWIDRAFCEQPKWSGLTTKELREENRAKLSKMLAEMKDRP